jgi:transcriptional regulator of acetoin/glycerol metabolism
VETRVLLADPNADSRETTAREREYLLATLERNRWRQSDAAQILGINRRTIHRKLSRYREQGLVSDRVE